MLVASFCRDAMRWKSVVRQLGGGSSELEEVTLNRGERKLENVN